jgi:acylphosphatase
MEEQKIIRLHAMVEGDVQGVGYRNFVTENARSLGLTGWARNRFDGSVEVLAEGPPAYLEILIAALKQGPRSARVTEVRTEWLPAEGAFSDFKIRYI